MIEDVDDLRERLGRPGDAARHKAVWEVDEGIERFLALCPFVVVATAGADGMPHASPRGGPPGFVRVLSPTRVAWGELPGNRLLYGAEDLAANPRAHVLALVPGVTETIRLEGRAHLTEDLAVREQVALDGRVPWGAFVLDVTAGYGHCGKALLRSGLWRPDTWAPPEDLPRMGAVIAAHLQQPGPDGEAPGRPGAEQVQAGLQASYEQRLW